MHVKRLKRANINIHEVVKLISENLVQLLRGFYQDYIALSKKTPLNDTFIPLT